VILLNVAKALEKQTNKVLSEVVAEEMVACKHPWFFAALSGLAVTSFMRLLMLT